jgi:hypothetical protein
MTTIERITAAVGAATRKKHRIAERFNVVNGERTTPYYVFQGSDGTTYGRRYPIREEAEAVLEAGALRDEDDMLIALRRMTEDQIAAQADYWLKGTP